MHLLFVLSSYLRSNEGSSSGLRDKCRINSFTWLELAGRRNSTNKINNTDLEYKKINLPKICAVTKHLTLNYFK